MLESPSLLVTVFAFLLLLGPLIVIHELGHYLVGRLFGVKADAFSVGFGKELTGWTDKRGTRWKLSAIPLGGYVQFAGDWDAVGMPDAEASKLSPHEYSLTFHAKPLWQRALIVLAGPLSNLIFAVLIFAAFFFVSGRVEVDPEVSGFSAKSDARAAGLQIGDRIVAIDGNRINSVSDVSGNVVYFPGRTITVSVERDGQERNIPVKLSRQELRDPYGNEATVADLGVDLQIPEVAEFADDSAAQAAGLKIGDRITSIDGAAITSFEGIRKLVRQNPGKTVSIGLRRAGQSLTLPVKLGSAADEDAQGKPVRIGVLGIKSGKYYSVGAFEAVRLGFERSFDIMDKMITGLVQIVTGERSVRELGGPIKIAKFSGEQFSQGWLNFVEFAALISINLAFINLLPIPALDGGHLAFYAAEAVRRKPLGLRSQEWAFRTGLALVLALMLFVTINDIASLRLFGG